MKTLISLCFIFQFIPSIFGQQVFNRIYYPYNDGNVNDGSRVNSVLQTSDGGFLITGTTKDGEVLCSIKINNNGDTLWIFKLNLATSGYADYLFTAIESNDGNYIVGGVSGSPIYHQSQADLIKLNHTNGDTIWVRQYGLLNRSERCYSVKQTPDKGFVFCGWRYDSTGTTSLVYFVKTDSLGNEQWEKTYGGVNYNFANSLEFTSEGGYMIFGYTYSYGAGPYNMYLIKTDSLGNMLWQKTYGNNLASYGNFIIKTTDGNYVLAGGNYISTDTIAAYILKVDTAGIVIWQKRYIGISKEEEFTAVKELPTGDIIATGDMQGDPLNYSYYGILKKLDNTGTQIWGNQYHYFNTDTTQHYFYSMDVCNDGGFVMAGMTIDAHYHVTVPRNAMWLVKTDCMGNDSIWDNTNCVPNVGVKEKPKPTSEMVVYPNPANDLININIEGITDFKNTFISIYDNMGRIILKEKVTSDKKEININNLSNGLYLVQLQSGQRILSNKLVKE